MLARLAAEGYDVPQVRSLFGGSSFAERAEVRESFNEASDPIRLLAATDVAAEGLNLQTSCRYVVHYIIPSVSTARSPHPSPTPSQRRRITMASRAKPSNPATTSQRPVRSKEPVSPRF